MNMDPFEPFRRAASEHVMRRLAEEYGVEESIQLETGGDIADFTYPCFQLAKKIGKSPADIALALSAGVQAGIIRVRATGGYVNIDAQPELLARETVKAVNGMRGEYGRTDAGATTVLVEHTSINPTGPMHIGRTRNAVIGDTLVRCMRQAGVAVSSEYYVNDVGKQVVVLYWGLKKLMKTMPSGKADHELLQYYVKANEMLEKDESAAAEVKDLQQRLEGGDTALLNETRKAAELVLGGIRESLQSINVIHDKFSFESDLIRDGSVRKVIDRLRQLPEAGEEKGAWFIPFGGEEEADRFYFTRSDGTSLYTTRDLAYHMDKLSRFGHLVDVLGEDQKLGMKFLIRTLELLGEAKRIDFLFHSFVSLVEGRMSTRHGVGVMVDDVVTEAKARAREEVLKRRSDMPAEQVDRIASAVGVGAVRYNIVRLQPEKKLVFKWDEALNFEGSSAPFVQYSHARACSILEKAGGWAAVEPSYEEENELRLARQLALFPSVLREVSRTLAVHKVAAYAQQTASEFNQFYRVVPVLKAPENRLPARLSLVNAARIVLENTLGCLGIEAPKSM